jgi:hypothetical protein
VVGAPSRPRTPATEAPDDRIELSDAARLLQRLRDEVREVAETGAVAGDRIDALRAQVARDSYHPAPREVAEKLIAELAANLLA